MRPLFTGLMIAVLPIVVIFLVFQRHVAESITFGAVK